MSNLANLGQLDHREEEEEIETKRSMGNLIDAAVYDSNEAPSKKKKSMKFENMQQLASSSDFGFHSASQ